MSANVKGKRVEILSGPDDAGKYRYFFYWTADYHPGDPRGEHRLAERAQIFNCVPSAEHRALFPRGMRP